MEPASSIIKELGGATKVAEVTGVHRTGVWKWTQPKEAGGSAGMIPTKHIPKLLEFARENDLPITAESFFATPRDAEARQ